MINAYIPSKDRSMQCDLLLRSLRENAPFIKPLVVYTGSTDEYIRGYDILQDKHAGYASFEFEYSSEGQFYSFLEQQAEVGELVILFADDCIFFRNTNVDENYLRNFFKYDNLWTFTYRLGRNISIRDYVNNRPTNIPKDGLQINDHLIWDCQGGDFWDVWWFSVGFDGYVYRAQDLLTLSERSPFGRICFWEGMICRKFCENPPKRKLMACPEYSSVFVEQINTTHSFQHHTTNQFNVSCKQLNDEWLQGKEIDLLSMDFSILPNCTHGEKHFSFKHI